MGDGGAVVGGARTSPTDSESAPGGQHEAAGPQGTDVLTEVNWRPLLFFAIAAAAGVVLLLVLAGDRRQVPKEG
jgi:hypothetical protein